MSDRNEPRWEDDSVRWEDEDVRWEPEEEETFLDKAFKPLWTGPTRAAQYITKPQKGEEDINQFLNKIIPGLGTGYSQYRGFQRGVVQGAGDVLTSMTNPVDITATALFGGSNLAARAALKYGLKPALRASKYLYNIGRGLSAPVVAHGALETGRGAKELYESGGTSGWGRTGFGLIEMAGGGAGLATPWKPRYLRGEKPKVRLNPDGTYTDELGRVRDSYGGVADKRQQAPPVRPPVEPDIEPDLAGETVIDLGEEFKPTPEVEPQVTRKTTITEDVPERGESGFSKEVENALEVIYNYEGDAGFSKVADWPEERIVDYAQSLLGDVTAPPSAPEKMPGPVFRSPSRQGIGPGEGNLFQGSEGRGLGTESFEQQWQQAINEAQQVGIDPSKYDNLDELQWDITRETARRTRETGQNPLTAPRVRSLYEPDVPDTARNVTPGAPEGLDPVAERQRLMEELNIREGPYTNTDLATLRRVKADIDSANAAARWEREPGAGPGMNPNEVARIVGDVTLRDTNVEGFGGTIGTSAAPERIPAPKGLEELAGGPPKSDILAPFVSKMKVPGVREGIGGVENVALGGADPEVLDMLGTALYTSDRPKAVAKELLQNALDERKLSGLGGVVRIVTDDYATLPDGSRGKAIIMQDEGRGLNAEQIHTIFSDVGKSGKRDDPTAAGGFGFAKAAPFLAGKHLKVTSVTVEGGRKVRYTFEGNPVQLKNQKKGVPLNMEVVPDETPTGMKVEVFFDDKADLFQASNEVRKIVQGSPGVKDVEIYDPLQTSGRKGIPDFLAGKGAPNRMTALEGPVLGPKKETIDLPTAEVDVYYDLDNKERTGYDVIYLNNGIYVKSDRKGVGWTPKPHIPEKVVYNIRSKVEEGVEGYPFGLNRQELNETVLQGMNDWTKAEIVDKAESRRIDELQQVFDDLKPIMSGVTTGINDHVILDSGGRMKPIEMQRLANSRRMRRIGETMKNLLDYLAAKFPNAPYQTVKHGFRISDRTKGGVNIPSPKDRDKTAILIDPFSAILHSADPEEAANRILHIINHEFNHNLARDEGGAFTWELANVYTKFPLAEQGAFKNDILDALTDPTTGDYASEIQGLLQDYNGSRGNPETVPDLLSREAESIAAPPKGPAGVSGSDFPDGGRVSSRGVEDQTQKSPKRKFRINPDGSYTPVDNPTVRYDAQGNKISGEVDDLVKKLFDSMDRAEMGGARGNTPTNNYFKTLLSRITNARKHWKTEVANLPRTMISAFDVSFGMRQGVGLIHSKSWWKNMWRNAFKSLARESAFNQVHNEIFSRPNAKNTFKNGEIELPVYKRMGIAFSDLDSGPQLREEQMVSQIAEAVPGIRNSNRAYVAAANTIRADNADVLYAQAKKLYETAARTGKARRGFFTERFDTPGSLDAINPDTNPELMRAMGDYINNASGRGSLGSWENSATKLSALLFSPRLMASRLQMMNPRNYIRADPFVRKQYLKSVMAISAMWGTFATLAALGGAEVSDDLSSTDFGKIKIGNTRFDLGGGFQQYLVLFNRLATGKYTTSTTKEPHKTGEGYGSRTRGDIAVRFLLNKMAPVPNAIGSWMFADEYEPFDLSDRVVRLFTPLILQDISEILQDDPDLAKLMGIPLSAMGVGVQSYDERGAESTVIPGVTGPYLY